MRALDSRAVGAVLFLFTVACGGSDPGTGTQTLWVSASAESDGSAGGTDFDVEVREGSSGGAVVDDAAVVLRSDKGTEHELTSNGSGLYSKSGFAWEAGWRLRITRGEDRVEAYLSAPGLTEITEPVSGASFDRGAGNPLVIRWRDASGRGADEVRVELNDANLDRVLAEDRGSYEVTQGLLVSGPEQLDVERSSIITLAGAAPGSTFRATTTDQVDFTVQ